MNFEYRPSSISQNTHSGLPHPSLTGGQGAKLEPQDSVNSRIRETFSRLKPYIGLLAELPGPGTYADLQSMREAKRILIRQAKFLSHATFDSSGMKRDLDTLHQKLDGKIATLMGTEEIKNMVRLEKAVAIRKAQRVRNKTVMTWQMAPLLQEHMKTDKANLLMTDRANLQNIALALCILINKAIKNPSSYTGNYLQLKEMQYLGLPCWLKLSNDAFKLIVKTQDQEPIAEGHQKIVAFAHNFIFSLKGEISHDNALAKRKYRRNGQCTPMVIHELRDKHFQFVTERGIGFQKKIQKLAPKAKFPPLPRKLRSPDVEQRAGQYCQPWYHSDLWKAIHYHTIPLTFTSESQTTEFTLFNTIHSICEVGASITEWHKIGYIHRDLTPANLLLSPSPDNDTITAVASDFEMVQRPGLGFCPKESYLYWDSLSHLGLATYFTDTYALTMCLLTSLVPEITSFPPGWASSEEGKQDLLARAVSNMVTFKYDPKTYSPDSYINKVKEKLSNTVNTYQYPHAKKSSQKTSAMIEGAKQIIWHAAMIVEIDQKLSKAFPGTLDPVLQSIQQNEGVTSREQQNNLIAKEIEQWMNHQYRHLARIISTIPNWNEMTSVEKVRNTKTNINRELANGSLDLGKGELKDVLKKMEMRENALQFMNYMAVFSKKKQLRHPLFKALKEPMELNDQEFEDQINKEIQKFEPAKENTFRVRSKEVVKGKTGSFARREAVKQMLVKTIQDPKERLKIKSQFKAIFDHIVMIERAMAFALETRDLYRQKASEVTQFVADEFVARGIDMQPGMNIMEAFVSHVNAMNRL